MPKVPYTENSISNNPLPFPNYLNTLSLLTDSSTSSVSKFFNANRSISEALIITLINMIQEGIAYHLANHSNISSIDNNSKSYTNNTNFYCCKGVPIKTVKPIIKKRSNSFSYSIIHKKDHDYDDNSEHSKSYIIKDNANEDNQSINSVNSNNKYLKKNKLNRSSSSPKLFYSKGNTNSSYTKTFNNNLKVNNNKNNNNHDDSNDNNNNNNNINNNYNKVTNGSQLKYSFSQDLENSSVELSINNYDDDNTLDNNSNNNNIDNDIRSSGEIPSEKENKNKINVFILLKNLLNILDIFKSLSTSKTNHQQKPIKPFDSLESLNDKEKWEEFNRVYNETMYNLKTEEYYKSKSLIFKYTAGLNSIQGCYFDAEETSEDNENSAINNSMSYLDEKIRENSENKQTDILSRIKIDTLTHNEIKECVEYMRRVGIYQLFIQCPINHLLRKLASKLFSCGEKKYSPILRFLFVTCVISPIQISINILCLALSNKKTPSEMKKCFSNNFSHILKLSLLYVPFSTQYIARTFLPRHLWVPFFNLSSFVLGTYIKLIMKKKDDKKIIHF